MFSPDTIHKLLLHRGLLWDTRHHPSQRSGLPALLASEGWLTDIKWWKTGDCREGCSPLPFHWRLFTAARTEPLREQLFNSRATMRRGARWRRVTTCYCLSRQEGTTLLGRCPIWPLHLLVLQAASPVSVSEASSSCSDTNLKQIRLLLVTASPATASALLCTLSFP